MNIRPVLTKDASGNAVVYTPAGYRRRRPSTAARDTSTATSAEATGPARPPRRRRYHDPGDRRHHAGVDPGRRRNRGARRRDRRRNSRRDHCGDQHRGEPGRPARRRNSAPWRRPPPSRTPRPPPRPVIRPRPARRPPPTIPLRRAIRRAATTGTADPAATTAAAAAPAWPAGSDPNMPTQPLGTDQASWTAWETAATTALPTLSCADLEPYRGLDDPNKPLIACSDTGDAIYLLDADPHRGHPDRAPPPPARAQQGAGWVVNLTFKSEGYSTWSSYTASQHRHADRDDAGRAGHLRPADHRPDHHPHHRDLRVVHPGVRGRTGQFAQVRRAAAGLRPGGVGERQRPAGPGLPQGGADRRRHRAAAGDHLLPDLLPPARA